VPSLEIYGVDPADGFAAPWLVAPSGKAVFVTEGKLPPGTRAEWRPWRLRSNRRMSPVPDVSNSSSALLIRPDLVPGLPMTEGLDYLEVDVVRSDFPHRLLDFLPLEGVFNKDLSEYSTVEGLDHDVIVTVQKYVLNPERIGARRAFTMPEFGFLMFVTRAVVDYLTSTGARGLDFKKLWASQRRNRPSLARQGAREASATDSGFSARRAGDTNSSGMMAFTDRRRGPHCSSRASTARS
jgi:hypothetical protein